MKSVPQSARLKITPQIETQRSPMAKAPVTPSKQADRCRDDEEVTTVVAETQETPQRKQKAAGVSFGVRKSSNSTSAYSNKIQEYMNMPVNKRSSRLKVVIFTSVCLDYLLMERKELHQNDSQDKIAPKLAAFLDFDDKKCLLKTKCLNLMADVLTSPATRACIRVRRVFVEFLLK